MKNYILIYVSVMSLFSSCQERDPSSLFGIDWRMTTTDRHWAGPDIWLNPLQAWHQKEGSLNLINSGGDRNAVLLSREVSDGEGSLTISTSFEFSDTDTLPGWIGWQIGLQGEWHDYRDDAIKGKGLCAGLTTRGQLFIGDTYGSVIELEEHHKLLIHIKPQQDDLYEATITYGDINNNQHVSSSIHRSWLPGLIALTASTSFPTDTIMYQEERLPYSEFKQLGKRQAGSMQVSFYDWKVGGSKVVHHPDRTFGPILWTQYTVTDQTLKMSVQMAPVGNDNREVQLYVGDQLTQTATIDELGRNALFKVSGWDESESHTYLVRYEDNAGKIYDYEGTIQKDPNKSDFTIASLSCMDDMGFPHSEIVTHVDDHAPDLLVFHGDQLYERVAGYGVERNSILDYQRKWYLFGWTFRDLLKDVPSVIIPDDHDVFHGNLWGQGGKAADLSKGHGNFAQDSGGYKEGPAFVNMVHRTQTGHLPDPYDPTPVDQGISVYYTELKYGGLSCAILGDRQWKTAPIALMPEALIENGWPQNTSWDPKKYADHPDAELLGSRQEAFLDKWSSSWSSDTDFKVVVSQSPFCNVATLPADIWHDKYVPGLPRYKKGEYPPDDRPVADFDSNSWPQHGRNKAVKMIRRVGAIHLTGDQHLGSTGQYGVEAYGDAGYWISSPAISNLWPRRWFPAIEAETGKDPSDDRRYTGDYEDGFGNKITVHAIANPHDLVKEPSYVYDKAPGYSIIKFDKTDRTIELAVWPRWASPKAEINQPYEGWPITIAQTDGYGRKVAGYLDEVEVKEGEKVQVTNVSTGELEGIYKPKPGMWAPPIFDAQVQYNVTIIGSDD